MSATPRTADRHAAHQGEPARISYTRPPRRPAGGGGGGGGGGGRASTEVDRVREAVEAVTNVATLPQVTSRIVTLVENPRSSAHQLQAIVQNDPALVSRLLQVVNSSFYGLPGEIDSVERAIVLLGLPAVKNVAVAASLGQMFRNVDLGKGRSPTDLWRHCVAVAVGARELARISGMAAPDEAFLAGMVHDIGILAELQVWPERFRQVCHETVEREQPFLELERELLGTDHTILGAGLAAKWKFPPACRATCQHHHRPENAGEHVSLVAVVHAADVLASEVMGGFDLTAMHQHLKPQDAKAVYVDSDATDALREALPSLVSEVERTL